MAATILVGQALGAGSPQNAKKIGYAALLLGLTVTCGYYCINYDFLCVMKLPLFSLTDEIVIVMAVNLLLFAALYRFSDTIQMVVGGIYGAIKILKSASYILLLFSYWVIGMPLGFTTRSYRLACAATY